MKPPAFDYCGPKTLDEVLALLGRYGDDAKLLAGGQSLIPILNMRLAKPAVLIDLNAVAELGYIREEQGQLRIGALTRHVDVERSALVGKRQPLLAETVRHIGHLQIRNRGTIGGSLVHADPSAELPALMVALDAALVMTGPAGARTVGAGEFFLMYFTTCIRSDEVLTEVRVPVLPTGTGYAFAEVARRHGDFALAGVACTLSLADDGTVADCRLGLTGVGPAPVRAREAEERLKGRLPEPWLLAEAAGVVGGAVAPESDVHASAEYRRHLASVLTERALVRALERAEGGGNR